MSVLPAGPTDVLAVWTGESPVQDAIRIGDVLAGRPAVANHAVVLTHQDKLGRWMGMEGRPGGFGLADCTPYLADPRTATNHDQPRTRDQVTQLLAVIAKLTGTPYDWVGIAAEVAVAAGLDQIAAQLDRIWAWPAQGGLLPGHVFCTNALAAAYQVVKLPHPAAGHERRCSPGDWWEWNTTRAWQAAG